MLLVCTIEREKDSDSKFCCWVCPSHHQILGKKIRRKYYVVESVRHTSPSWVCPSHHQILGKKIRKKYYVVESVRHTSANLSLSITPSVQGKKIRTKNYVVGSVRHLSAPKKIPTRNIVVESVHHTSDSGGKDSDKKFCCWVCLSHLGAASRYTWMAPNFNHLQL